jgi:hypothetical protein
MGAVRKRLMLAVFAAAVMAIVIPSASADVCYGACGGTGGTTGGGTTTPLNRLSVSNATLASTQVPEGSDCDFEIHRLKPRSGRTTVHFHTKDGTATSQPQDQEDDPDYDARSGVVTFSAEQPSVIHVLVHTDNDLNFNEDTEYFFLVITKPTNGDVVDATGKCFIENVAGD